MITPGRASDADSVQLARHAFAAVFLQELVGYAWWPFHRSADATAFAMA